MVRLISDIVSIYQLPLNYPKKSKKIHLLPIQIYKNIQEKYPNTYANQTKIGPVTWTVDKDSYPIQLQGCIDGIIYNLEIGSDHVFYWIKKLYDFAKQDGVPKFEYFKILWEVLHRFIDRDKEYAFVSEQIGALQEFYKRMTHQEKPIYLYHAVLLIVRRKEIDWTSKPEPININMDYIDKLYSDHLSGVKVKIDDYVMDMHTRRGKKGNKCMENFALVGAKVKNVNDKLLNKEYREIYFLIGKELDCYNNSIKQVR
jgi:hypothetical protein